MMIRFFSLLLFFFISFGGIAQEEIVHSIYFDTNKSEVDPKKTTELVDFIKKTDSIPTATALPITPYIKKDCKRNIS